MPWPGCSPACARHEAPRRMPTYLRDADRLAGFRDLAQQTFGAGVQDGAFVGKAQSA
jgi:hypothetical protein